MQVEELKSLVIDALEDRKAVNITTLDVREFSSVADYMVVAEGTSRRHVASVADHLVYKVKQAGLLPIGVEGQDSAEWVLVDLGDVIVHVMMPDTRAYYDLEKLWQVGARPPVEPEAPKQD